jgi:ABC-type multidrug transport system permease subunit
MVRVFGYRYLVVLALVTGEAVEAREGQKLGAYFADGGKVAGVMVLVIVGYTAAILILTSHRVRLTRSALPIAIATGTLTGVALFACYGFHLNSPPLTWWVFTALVLPLVTGFAVTRLRPE